MIAPVDFHGVLFPSGGAGVSHPTHRPAEPDHPMSLEGGVGAGDTALMLRCLAEELLTYGVGAADLSRMVRNPEFQGLYAAACVLGPERAEAIVSDAAARVGVHRHRVWESADQSRSATLTISAAGRRGGAGAPGRPGD